MSHSKTKFYIGTAGWKYEDWVGSFYPKKETGSFDWLQYYSHYFNCIEVNSTFYAYMNDRVASAWIRKTEGLEDFVFTIKLHQDFTHKRKYTKQNIAEMSNLLDALRKAGRLGGLLIQFPQSFKFDSTSAHYISELKEVFCKYDIFLEVRHGSFQSAESLDFFKTAKINCITIDQPQLGNAAGFKPFITCDSLYFRLHGRNKEEWFKGFDKTSSNNFDKQAQTEAERSARYNYMYSPGELVEISEKIKSVLDNIVKVFIITNNHPKGNAVANAFQLINMLEKRKVLIAEPVLKTYSLLNEIAENFENNLFS